MKFQKFHLKQNIFKTFYESGTVICVKEIIQPPHQIKASYVSLPTSKNFQTEIYKNIQTFPLQMLQDYSSWASRHGAVQIFFFWHQLWSFFWVCCGSIIFILLSSWNERGFLCETVLWKEWFYLLVFVCFETFYQKISN